MLRVIKKIRNFFLSKIVWRHYKIGSGFYAGARVRLWARDILIIGKDFYIGRDSFIETNCIIGDYVLFGNKVGVVGRYDHHFQQVGEPIRQASVIRDSTYSWKGKDLVTVIENDVWVGYGSTILQGVTIHEGAIIAAGSVVTKDVEPYSIYAGNPARKIKNRFDTDSDLKAHIELSKKYYSRLPSETHNIASFNELNHLYNFS